MIEKYMKLDDRSEKLWDKVKLNEGVFGYSDFLKYSEKWNMYSFELRRRYTEHYGFYALNDLNLDMVAEYIKYITGKETPVVLEIGAGLGHMSYQLIKRGINCIANEPNLANSKYFCNVEERTAISLDQFNILDGVMAVDLLEYDIILSSWSPYNDPLLYNILMGMRKRNPNCYLIAITEGRDGCIADDKFFNEAVLVDRLDDINQTYIQWYGIRDRLELYK